MKTEKAWWANIYVGLYNKDTKRTCLESSLRQACQKYCDKVGLCVTFTPTTYIYTGGNEPGVIVGLIQYPRFPTSEGVLRKHAIKLGKCLLKEASQYKVSIMFPSDVVMLEREDV